MYEEEESRPPTQEWFVTFADMMALLLTFFIMLVSAADFRPEDTKKFKAVSAHVRQKTGGPNTLALEPGELRPRDEKYARVAAHGRSNPPNGSGASSFAVSPSIEMKRSGGESTQPSASARLVCEIAFLPAKTELSEENKRELVRLARERLGATTGTIELRALPALSGVGADEAASDDAWRIAYQRVRRTRAFLSELGIAPGRMRVSVVQHGQPSDASPENSTNRASTLQHGGVEVLLLNEGPFQTATLPSAISSPTAASAVETNLQQR